MPANDSRPVNLNLTKFSFPVTAIASITHRVCAVIIWVGLGIALVAIQMVGNDQDALQGISQLITDSFVAQFVCWGLLSAFGYYCAATAKHLIQDLGYFEDFSGGKMISWTAFAIGAVLCIGAGVYVWA